MALNPIQILKDTISSVLHTIVISSVDSLGSSKYKINTENTLYLRTALAKKFITIDAVDYFIIDFELNTFLTVKAVDGTDQPVTASSFTINPPLFVWGNPQMVSEELVKRVKNQTVIWPYMWIVETGSTDGTLDPAAAVKETRNFNIFFLDSADKTNWTIEDHYDNDIYTLTNYIDFFFDILKSRRDLFETDSITYSKENHVNFGDYIVDEGMKELILNGAITGVQLQISIPYIIDTCSPTKVLPNCPIISETFNGAPISSPVTLKNIIVQTDGVGNPQTGTVIVDTPDALTIEVLASSSGVISSLLVSNMQDVSFLAGDDGDRFLNGDYATVNLAALSDPYTLVVDNEWGHKKRFAGDTGGFMDELTGLFHDVNGVLTTKILAFPNEIQRDYAFRRRWFQRRSGSRSWINCITLAQTENKGGETGWFNASQAEYEMITISSVNQPTYIDSRLFNFSTNTMWSSTTEVKQNSTRAFQLTASKNTWFDQTKTTNGSTAYVKLF